MSRAGSLGPSAAAAPAGRWDLRRPNSPASGGDVPLVRDAHLPLVTALVTRFLETLKEFRPRQKAASFTIDQVVEKLEAAITSHRRRTGRGAAGRSRQ